MGNENSLKSKTLSGLLFKTLERVGTQGISLAISIILARLMSPEDYGNVNLILVFVTLFDIIINYGFGSALIQKKDPDSLDFSSCMYASLAITAVIYVAMFFASPLIASFFGNAALSLMLRVVGIRVIFAGINSIQYAYIAKNFLFRKTFLATIISTLISGALGIVMAYYGAKEWALIAQSLASSVILVIVLAISLKMEITFRFSFDRIKQIFSLGSRLMLIGILNSVYSELRSIIIGKKYTTADLAFYDKGRNLPKLASNNINAIIDGVMFSTLSKVQDDKKEMVSILSRSIRTAMFALCPMLVGLALVSDNLIMVLYTETWMEAAFYLKIFCISFLTMPVITMNLNAIKAAGKGNLALGINVATVVISVASLIVSMLFGVRWIAVSNIFVNVIQTLIYMWYANKLFGYRFAAQFKDMFFDLVPTVIMGVCVFGAGFIGLPTIAVLLIQIAVGAGVFLAASILTKNSSYTYLLATIKNKVKKA